MEAFILLKVKGNHRNLMRDLSEFEGVHHVYNIAGDNDVLVKVKIKKLENLKNLINKIRSMENVLETTSYIVLSRYK